MNKLLSENVIKPTKNSILYTVLLIAVMVLVALMYECEEIIFPEITALCIGAWVTPKQAWVVTPVKLCVLITMSAILGIIISMLPIYIFFKALIGLVAVSIALIYSNSSFVPMLSACILPIFMHVTTIIYPISVCVMSIIIVTMQRLLHGNYTKEYSDVVFDKREHLIMWCKRISIIAVVIILPLYFGEIFFIAPPLLVVFVECTNIECKLRRCPGKAILLMFLSAFVGAYSRILIAETFHFSIVFSVIVAVGLILIIMKHMSLFVPPAGAIATLPTIVAAEKLWIFPLEVIVGFVTFYLLAIILFREKHSLGN